MNPPHSSSSSTPRTDKKPSQTPAPPASQAACRKMPMASRYPLKDLNTTASSSSCSTSISTSTISSSSSSSTISVEAPRSCLSFFLPTNASPARSRIHTHRNLPKGSALSRTPKSAPITRPSKLSRSKPYKENAREPTSQIVGISKKNSRFQCQWRSSASQNPHSSPISQRKKQRCFGKIGFGPDGCGTSKLGSFRMEAAAASNCTPVGKPLPVSALNSGIDRVFEQNSDKKEKNTPPIEASVSPEIHCGSVVISTTPACYGAGHVISGVSDKRKCRPRGILTVGENDFGVDDKCESVENGENGYVLGFPSRFRTSHIPSPIEASMCWLLSPCDEEDENQKNNPVNRSPQSCKVVAPKAPQCPSVPSSCQGVSPEIETNGDNITSRVSFLSLSGLSGPHSDGMAITSSFPSPQSTPGAKAVISQEDREEQVSPLSVDSLGSENVIQTPESDSSSGRIVRPSWKDVDGRMRCRFEKELDSEAVLQGTSLSSQNQVSMWDSVGLNFQFTHMDSPHDSVDLTQFHRTGDYQSSWNAISSLDNASQSQLRISWRDGLVNRKFEMDDMDICRCLSDEEEENNACIDVEFASHQSSEPIKHAEDGQVITGKAGSPKYIDEKGKEKFPSQKDNPCAESICTDGGSLLTSGDSDWTLCYKNGLFEV